MKDLYPTANSVDVLLLLEGTYPFVQGGVSSWVKQIIEGLPNIQFGIVFLGSRECDYPRGMRYALPKNLAHLEVHYLFEENVELTPVECKGDSEAFKQSAEFHEKLRQCEHAQLPEALYKIDEAQFYFSQESWNYISKMYEEHCTDPSFIDYFWTIRNLHRPIWTLAKQVQRIPTAKVYHSVSTGYAGFLGALLQSHHQKPYVITEHGIYTKERRIDLLQQQWQKERKHSQADPTQISYQRQLWVRFFESLARMAYSSATPIISLFSEYQKQQVIDGAENSRTKIIPNGVDLNALLPLITARPTQTPQVMCLIGRVVPIKDVKTFIRAVSVVAHRLPTVQAWIVGPADENPEYLTECEDLVNTLGLAEFIQFKGMQKIQDILPHVGVVVLSSISEGLPLVVLESHAAGVPVVCTNVGACKELVVGIDEDDQALGASGIIVDIASPQELGEAVIEFLTNEKLWQQASRAGIDRVRRYYDLNQVLNQYGDLYQTLM